MTVDPRPPHSRREFLRDVTAGAGALSVTGLLGACRPSDAVESVGFALVGLGGLSTHQIAPALQKAQHCRLAGVVTGSPEKSAAWAERYGIPARNIYDYDGFDRIAENDDIDAVYIALPNSMHADFTVRAAKAGKHVLCEKPMANTVVECDTMIAACKQAKTLLAVAYRCQFDPHHIECMRMAREQDFGATRLIQIGFGFHMEGGDHWRLKKAMAGGGALMDLGVSCVQAARYLSGEEPVRVVGTETKTDPERFAEVDETMCWTMTFASGVVAQCTSTYGFGGLNRFWVGAERGWFGLDQAFAYAGLRGMRSDGKLIDLGAHDQFVLELDDFARCVLEGSPTRVSGEEGRDDLRIIEAIYRSVTTGRAIDLS